jgi:hypothetical protein
MMRTIRYSAVLGLLLAAAACENDSVNRPPSITPVDALFDRYVAIGNSITAGFQSAGINDSTQTQSYAVLLARAMHAPFFPPLLRKPGCPAPFTNAFTGARFGGGTPTGCALRTVPSTPPPFISNVAVPGARVIDTYDNIMDPATTPQLNTIILGGQTQVQAARRANPTFVSVWIGNNDVLGAATAANAGDTTRITPPTVFQTVYSTLLDSIADMAPQGVVLIGVANVTAIPYFSAGALYWAIKNGLGPPGVAFPPTFTVSPNCAPISTGIPGARGDSVLVPFPYGGALLGAAAAGQPRNLDCADTVAAVVVPSELVQMVSAVTAYNTFISGQATAHGWAYFNPNGPLDSLRQIPTQVAPFPNFGAPPTFTACSANPFGLAFSCDAVHPSASTHRLIAQYLRNVINAQYGTEIPAVP